MPIGAENGLEDEEWSICAANATFAKWNSRFPKRKLDSQEELSISKAE